MKEKYTFFFSRAMYLDGYSEESLEDVIVASLSREKEVVA